MARWEERSRGEAFNMWLKESSRGRGAGILLASWGACLMVESLREIRWLIEGRPRSAKSRPPFASLSAS